VARREQFSPFHKIEGADVAEIACLGENFGKIPWPEAYFNGAQIVSLPIR
jgi:hypothetical protein